MTMNQPTSTTEYLKAGTPITLEFAGTHFIGVVEDSSMLARNDGMLVTIYDAKNTNFSGSLPICLSVPYVSRRIRSKRLRSPTRAEYERLIRAKAAIQATSCLIA